MTRTRLNSEVIQHAIDGLNNVNSGIYGCDLHNELFNTAYFIIAEEFLKRTDGGIFGLINLIKEYEQDNFGQVSTDLSSSEKVANMYAYIIGEQVLAESQTLQDNWDNLLTDENIAEIKAELQSLLDLMERVIFCKEGDGILAVFPSLKCDKVNLTCYAHVGQHSAICPDYFKGLEVVENPKDYLELQNELLSLGYELNVLNGKPDTILRNVLKTK